MSQCFVCDEILEGNKSELVQVKDRGIKTFCEASVKRKDGKHILLEGLKNVTIHEKCRKLYINERMIAAHIRRLKNSECSQQRTRSSVPAFSFQTHCFLCAKEITLEFLDAQARARVSERREIVYSVRKLDLKDNIINIARNRKDDWGEEIINRIEHVSDLVAADAQYHNTCMKKLYRYRPGASEKKKKGPFSNDIEKAMSYIYTYLEENSDECQFSLEELVSKIEGNYQPHMKTVKAHLLKTYGEGILIAQTVNKSPVVCFRSSGYKLLTDAWYEHKHSNEVDERLRVVQTAAEIILEDIRSMVYETQQYPPPDNFFQDVQACVPKTLETFLDTLIVKRKKGSTEKWKKRCIAIAHSIIYAIRPKSFVSTLLVGIAAFLHKKFGSRKLIETLSSLGFCAPYSEAVLFETSAIQRPPLNVDEEGFSQFSFDNADFNTQTSDGHHTFHAMGGIQCITPATAVTPHEKIARLQKIPTAAVVGKIGAVQLKTYDSKENIGLGAITVEVLGDPPSYSTRVVLSAPHILWLYGKWTSPDLPGWSGFMSQVTTHLPFQKTFVACLPFVNSPPSDYDTVYTVLKSASGKCKSLKQSTCFVTFDQPLYIKAREIVSNCNESGELQNVVVRLGGFHLLMSFMGAVGYIMEGSGLKELFATIYAVNSIEKIMLGRAYSRAVRAHILTHFSIAVLLLESVHFTPQLSADLEQLFIPDLDGPKLLIAGQEECVKELVAALEVQLNKSEQRGCTAKLWVQYFYMTSLLKNFIEAERTGNWELHLSTVKKMLPFMHASGHFAYSKAIHIYLQDMMNLENRMPTEEYHKFTAEGYFTVRRTDNFWSGTWSDMAIEQSLMKSMKSSGGLTHGRGVSESVLSRWTLGSVALQSVCDGIEQFCNVSFTTSEQHVEIRSSRINRDNKDVAKLTCWLRQHYPFPDMKELVSVSTGIVGDASINCHNAQEIGECSIGRIIGKNFSSIKFKRNDRVKPLSTMSSAIVIEGETVPVNPTSIFQRISILKRSDTELKEFLRYELAPYPLSLFTEEGMRKGTKSALYKIFQTCPQQDILDEANCVFVIDGGLLLHRVPWRKGDSFSIICDKYVKHVVKIYGATTTVVFDGYQEEASYGGTKYVERNRRSRKRASTHIVIDESVVPTIPQENFLANSKNKMNLIKMLAERLSSAGIQCKQAKEDADVLIVNTAIDFTAENKSVVVVGEDVDLLVLLVSLRDFSTEKTSSKIYFLKPGRGKIPKRLYDSTSAVCDTTIVKSLLFVHAFGGCDTTSAPYGKGKMKLLSTLKKDTSLLEVIDVFRSANATPSEIERHGEKFFLALYDCQTQCSLDFWRYHCFVKSAFTTKSNLFSLPPTKEAAKQHSYRAYYQIQHWLGVEKSAEEWGWRKTAGGLMPITTLQASAPEAVLKLIRCGCKKGCMGGCSCRKAGIHCSILCSNCNGTCENVQPIDDPNDFEDTEDNSLENLRDASQTDNEEELGSFIAEHCLEQDQDASETVTEEAPPVMKKRRKLM